MSNLWFPNAARMPAGDNGAYTGGPPKGLLHSTETPFGNTWATYTGDSKPHVEAIGITASRTVAFRQFYPRDMPSRSLQDTTGYVRTNRDSVFQIELGFKAARVAEVPDWFWEGLRPLLRWVEDEHGVNPDVWAEFRAYPAVLDNPVRFSSAKWDDYNGWCGHQHCPENDHGDPGDIPVAKLRRGDWFNMATEADLKRVVDASVSADNPSFVNAVRVAIEQERAEDAAAAAAAVWDTPYTHPNGTTAKMKVWLAYTNTKVDDLRAWLTGKLGA